ncbi:MAG: hypothetical protein PWP28_2534 [Oceanotoga sp.]|uniref:hypothetical protein n=1 Tax=Oceanotoga sp. TaxID=2108366 RepID=UPI00264F8F77|nr:hypothetical protein [Oceanotoga sp.]MDN5343654.1 hypothetical protein [Oceanotoga sp.]
MLFVNNELHNENTKIVRFRDPDARLEEGIKRITDWGFENKEWMVKVIIAENI